MPNTSPAPAIRYAAPIPKYFQIQGALRERFREACRPGDVVPSEATLAREFAVSRITIRQALDTLAREGLLERSRGRRTRVTPRISDGDARKVSGLLVDLLRTEPGVTAKILSIAAQPAGAEVGPRLKRDPDDEIFAIERLILLQGTPLAFLQAYLPSALGSKVIRENLEKVPVIEAIRRRCGVEVSAIAETVEACPADVKLSQLLEVELGAPLLKIVRVYFSDASTPIDYVVSYYRGDRYRHSRTITEISRPPILKERSVHSGRRRQ